MEAFGPGGIGDGQQRRQHFVGCLYAFGAAARGLQRFGQHPCHGLLMKHHFAREQGLVAAIGAAVILARDVVRGQSRVNAGLGERRRGVQLREHGVSVRGQHRPGVQQEREAARQIVRVQRLAGDMSAGAFMRNRLAGNVHAAASVCCSHQNFSSRFCARASRYAAEPR